jgi:hypothetical protein
MTAITIDCDECAMQHTTACADCVVTFLCDRPEGAAVVLQLAEARALRVLADAGLAPALRHRPQGEAVGR